MGQRVLMVGMNKSQLPGEQRSYPHVWSKFSQTLADGISDLDGGHVLTWSEPRDEYDPADFDCALIHLGEVSSIASRWSWSTLGLAYTFLRAGTPTYFFVSEYNARSTVNAFANIIRKPDRLYIDLFAGRPAYREVSGPKLIDAMRWMLENWPPTICCLCDFGDHQRFVGGTPFADRYVQWDPGRLMPMPKYPNSVVWTKHRRWVNATYIDHARWVAKQETRWPVAAFGRPKEGAPRVPELVVCDAISQSWGVLQPPYYHKGSGYWRARITQSAFGHSVLVADPEEYPFEAYQYSTEEVEVMDTKQLTDLAGMQEATEHSITWPEAHALNQVLDIIYYRARVLGPTRRRK